MDNGCCCTTTSSSSNIDTSKQLEFDQQQQEQSPLPPQSSPSSSPPPPPPPQQQLSSIVHHPILQRHYSTIGIGDVFVCRNRNESLQQIHTTTTNTSNNNNKKNNDGWLFPSDYLLQSPFTSTSLLGIIQQQQQQKHIQQILLQHQHKNGIDTNSYNDDDPIIRMNGDEMIGQIKSVPEDFIVQEIAILPGHPKEFMADVSLQLPLPTAAPPAPVAPAPAPSSDNQTLSSKKIKLEQVISPATTNTTSSTKNGKQQLHQNSTIIMNDDPIQRLEYIFQHHLHSYTNNYIESIDTTSISSSNSNTNTSNTNVQSSQNKISDDTTVPETISNNKCIRTCNPTEMISIIQHMEQFAIQRIQSIYDNCHYDIQSNTLPPFTNIPSTINKDIEINLIYPIKSSTTTTTTIEQEQYKQHKSDLHECIRYAFPLLVAESYHNNNTNSCTNNNDKCYYYSIRLSIDETFDELIPYLYNPIEDLPPLYKYAKYGYESTIIQQHNGKKVCNSNHGHNNDRPRRNGCNLTSSTDNTATIVGNKISVPILRLIPNLPRSYRRPIHQLIDTKSKNLLGTETLNDIPIVVSSSSLSPSDTSTVTTTAIRIGWTKMAARRATKKRQRSQMSSSATTNATPARNAINNNNKILCVVKKRQREHLGMINTISALLKCSPSDIGFAGMKDLQAVTYQFGTLNSNAIQRLKHIPTKELLLHRGIEILPLHPVSEPLNKGDLIGNSFQIILRNVRRVQLEIRQNATIKESFIPVDDEHLQCMIDRVCKYGFINFFGEQRVGDPGHTSMVGVRAFDIGRAMLQQDYTMAIDLLITGRRLINGIELVGDNIEPFRRIWKESNGDPIATAKALPSGNNSVPRERAILKGLVRYGIEQPLSAFRCLPRNERLFFVNAYQSYVWNMMVTERMKRYGNQVVVGDLILIEKEGISTNKPHVVTKDDIVLNQSEGKMFDISNVVLPMPGYDVIYPSNDIGILYQEFLHKEQVQFDNKNILNDESKARGSYRRIVAYVKNFTFERIIPSTTIPNSNSTTITEPNDTTVDIQLQFCLPKGSYATMLLRELMLKTVARDGPEYCTAIPNPSN